MEILGAATAPEGPFIPLASGVLSPHDAKSEVTELTMAPDAREVLWVRLRLSGGLDGAQMTAAGRGEDDPIASNEDDAVRSMNRRVEVRCAG